jgi:energy-coupling factor transporter transmembrane protein EcfT
MKSLKFSNSGFNLTNMCTPATIYFVISLIALVMIGVNNLDNSDQLCIGDYNCYVGNNTVIFIFNAIYILFWTFILDIMCKSGYSSLSWFILLLPFIILFIVFLTLMNKEGNSSKEYKKYLNSGINPDINPVIKPINDDFLKNLRNKIVNYII